MKLLDVAITQIGVTEDAAHTNHGEAVKYQIAAGLPKGGGFPWCQSLVYWCGMTAYGNQNPVPKTGGVLDCWHKAVASETLDTLDKSEATPQNILPGYQFILDEGHGNGHTGIVESVDADGRLHTIEGNSNTDGSRDGYAVVRQSKRHIHDANLVGFVCYTDPTT
jgi:hypothetical protein